MILTKTFCLILLLSATLDCSCEETTIFATGGIIMLGKINNLAEATGLYQFGHDLSGLSIHEDHLFISAKRSERFGLESEVIRMKISNLTNFSLDHSEVVIQKFPQFFKVDNLCVVVVKGYAFVGRSDGVLMRCSTNKPKNCEDFEKLGSPITGIDYSHKNDRVYLATASNSSNFGLLWSCAPQTANSCRHFGIVRKGSPTAVKVAYDNVWVATDEADLRYLPEVGDTGNVTMTRLFQHLYPSGNAVIVPIDGKLYVGIDTARNFWRCDPKKKEPCTRADDAATPDDLNAMITLG